MLVQVIKSKAWHEPADMTHDRHTFSERIILQTGLAGVPEEGDIPGEVTRRAVSPHVSQALLLHCTALPHYTPPPAQELVFHDSLYISQSHKSVLSLTKVQQISKYVSVASS